MLVPKDHASTGALHLGVNCAAMWGLLDIWDRVMARGHVVVHGLIIDKICVDVMVPVTIKGHATAQGVGCHLKQWWSLREKMMSRSC